MALYDIGPQTEAYETAQAEYHAAIDNVEQARLAWQDAVWKLREANGYSCPPMLDPSAKLDPFRKEASLAVRRAAAPKRNGGSIHKANIAYAALNGAGIKSRHSGNDLWVTAADKDKAMEVLTRFWNWHEPDSLLWRAFEPRDEVTLHIVKTLPERR